MTVSGSWAISDRELCCPLSSCAGRRTLRSSAHGNLVVPFAPSATMQTRSFSVVGPKTWNGLPVDLRHLWMKSPWKTAVPAHNHLRDWLLIVVGTNRINWSQDVFKRCHWSDSTRHLRPAKHVWAGDNASTEAGRNGHSRLQVPQHRYYHQVGTTWRRSAVTYG